LSNSSDSSIHTFEVGIGHAESFIDAIKLAKTCLRENDQKILYIEPRPVREGLEFGMKHSLFVANAGGKVMPSEKFLGHFYREFKKLLRSVDRGELLAAEIWEQALYEATVASTSVYTIGADEIVSILEAALRPLSDYFIEFGIEANCLVHSGNELQLEQPLAKELAAICGAWFEKNSQGDISLILLRECIKLVDMRLTAFCPDKLDYREALSLVVLKLSVWRDLYDIEGYPKRN
jgi:hypothetical protein